MTEHIQLNPSKKDTWSNLFIGISFPLMLFIVAPMTMYFGNIDEYHADSNIALGLFIFFVFSSAPIFIGLQLFNPRSKIYRAAAGVTIGLSAGSWIQSQLLVWDFGPLDGRGLNWEKYESNSHIEILIWVLILISSIVIITKNNSSKQIIARLLPMTGMATLLTLGISSATGSNTIIKKSYASTEKSLGFHKSNNSLIIVLDTFQSDAFQEIMDKHPEETEFLNGFSYFPDAIGGYPTTKHSIPLILTGSFYKNDFPYTPEARKDFIKNSIIDYYKNKTFGVVGHFGAAKELMEIHGTEISYNPNIANPTTLGINEQQLLAIDIGLFRSAPIIFKKHIYDEGRWLLAKYLRRSDGAPAPHGADLRFVKYFNEFSAINSKNNGEFKFIHLMGAHYPLNVNENYEFVKNLENTRENYVNQTRGVLKITRSMIERLKKLGVYDASEILIIGDHGAHDKSPIDMNNTEVNSEIPLSHIGAARPLFLFKNPGSVAPLRVDETPMHLAYIYCLMSKTNGGKCEDYDASYARKSVERHHFRYEWAHEFWYKDYSPRMRLYSVNGDSRNSASWKNMMIDFFDGKKINQEILREGEILDFGETGKSSEYIVSGWSTQEKNHRWTDGEEAILKFQLDDRIPASNYLAFSGFGFMPAGHDTSQQVYIEVNGELIYKWNVSGQETIKIRLPSHLTESNSLIVKFRIAAPTSPCEISQSSDCRKLGVALTSLSFANF